MTRCSKYDYANFDAKQFRNSFSIIRLNINKAAKKFDEFSAWLFNLSLMPTILYISETWCSADMPPCL